MNILSNINLSHITLNTIITSKIFMALISTLILPVLVGLVGIILGSITGAIGELLSGIVGYGVADFIMNNLSFVGTMHHELSHALFAFVTGANVTKIELYNPKEGSLGSVSYYTCGNIFYRSLQCVLASVAPVVCGYFSLNLIIHKLYPLATVLWQKCAILYLIFSIFVHMTMSPQDIKVALKGLPVTLIVLFVVIYYFNFNTINFTINTSKIIVDFFGKFW